MLNIIQGRGEIDNMKRISSKIMDKRNVGGLQVS